IDEAPEKAHDVPISPGEAMAILRRSVRRDIEALLNSRRRWRSWQATFRELSVSPLNYGIPDCTGGRFHGTSERDALRHEIEDTIRRFEPRFGCASRPSFTLNPRPNRSPSTRSSIRRRPTYWFAPGTMAESLKKNALL